MKRYVCRLVWLVVGMVMASAVQAQSSRIAFVSDRDDTDLNNWVMREDGTYPTQITSEAANVHRPSISPSGTRIVYEANGDLFMANTNGSGTPVTLANSPSGETYADPDAGPLLGFGNPGDFLVLFSRYYQYDDNPPLFARRSGWGWST